MGGSSSKVRQDKATSPEKLSFPDRVRAGVEDEIAKRAMIQREVQMALNIAKARDSIQIFGSAWLTLVSGASIAKIAGKPVPGMVAVPVVVGGIMLGNLADMAYGNKLQRVARETEYLLENERQRFVPFPQVRPFMV